MSRAAWAMYTTGTVTFNAHHLYSLHISNSVAAQVEQRKSHSTRRASVRAQASRHWHSRIFYIRTSVTAQVAQRKCHSTRSTSVRAQASGKCTPLALFTSVLVLQHKWHSAFVRA
eukprot:scaffold4332_cov19-Tisochrysis_lutea.AAC.1